MTELKVFLDTNILIKAFVAYRKGCAMPIYLTDPHAQRFTFEKCIYECYMIFRDVGKKKSGEKNNENNWAQKYLDKDRDPRTLPDLTNKYHDKNKWLASYWINQIEELVCDEYYHNEPGYKDLLRNRELFERLCEELREMLKRNNVAILFYHHIFGAEDQIGYCNLSGLHPYGLDILARTTIISSEDFEIVYAAMRIRADIFVTDDARLREYAGSLGLNLPLSPNAFCSGDEYESKIYEWHKINDD
jgi:hypothetical protein